MYLIITWNRSFRGVSSVDGANDDLDLEDSETHATVLDILLAWEKKLYEEVKVSVIILYDNFVIRKILVTKCFFN